MKITEHFSIEEAAHSDTAKKFNIDNQIPDSLMGNLHRMCEKLEQVRSLVGQPIMISSFYRCPELNTKVGGSKTSAHMDCRAVDFNAKFNTAEMVFNKIKDSKIEIDQCIIEQDKRGNEWVHIAIEKEGESPRNEFLRGIKGDTSSKFTRIARG